MTESEIYATLGDVFAELFLRPDLKIGPNLSAADVPGWDSFRQIEIVMAAEERFGVKFRSREIDALANVGDLVALVMAKRAGATTPPPS